MRQKSPETYEEKLAQLEELRDAAIHHASEAAVEKQHAKGKYTARERIEKLLDPGSFQELDTYMRHRTTDFEMQKNRPWGDAVVTGHGTIDGRRVCVFSQDFTVFGGSLGEVMAEKMCKIMDLAAKIGCPVIGINDSGGARIQEGVVSLGAYGDVFVRNVKCSGVIPQISLIMGPCAGGAVYSPAITDFIFMVKETSHMFITGPDVIKTVTGEEVEFEELGGAMSHNSKSGVAHFASDDEDQCLEDTRYLFSFLPQNNLETAPRVLPTDDPQRMDPELDEIVPANPNKPYDMREVVRGIVDDGEFFEVQEHFAQNIICGFSRLNGYSVGVVGNQPRAMAGVLDIDASAKAARFVRTCDAFNIPLLTFVDVPGFLPGTTQEWGGIIRHGAKLLYAFTEATVPKITVITRKAYGGAYDVMASKHMLADFNFAWPTAEIAVMGPEGAVNIIHRRDIASSPTPEQRREKLIDDYKARFANPYTAAERGYIDDVLIPHETRPKLITALETLLTKREPGPKRKHGNIPLYRRGSTLSPEQLHVAVRAAAALLRVAARALQALALRVVEGQRAGERGELGRGHGQRARARGRGGGRGGRVQQRPEQRQRAVLVVHDLDRAALLGPVDVGGGVDLPEAAALLALEEVHAVRVGVAGDVGDHVRVGGEQRLDRVLAGQAAVQRGRLARVAVAAGLVGRVALARVLVGRACCPSSPACGGRRRSQAASCAWRRPARPSASGTAARRCCRSGRRPRRRCRAR